MILDKGLELTFQHLVYVYHNLIFSVFTTENDHNQFKILNNQRIIFINNSSSKKSSTLYLLSDDIALHVPMVLF